jgi:thioredoxin-dependent peroxiredoxin
MSEIFPEFSFLGHDGEIYTRNNIVDTYAVIYFYPKDDTHGCTIEAKDFSDLSGLFEEIKTRIIGVSPDSVDSHCRFTKKFDIPFLLLSDTEKSLCTALELWGEKSMYGRKYWGVNRTTFVINNDGKILRVWKKVKPKGHAQEVLEYVKSL